ncbi:acylphosphatase [Parendozoicomonas haliclonae]|uniref:acylphosphatase n=1 Tax=Parendozoicomonas haliclonae TaxID=1960125 RepID=A0A1X7ART3_9GAMM|nr:acylphosphatase [Parendozoicomonas haliclonae]SMA50117.1 Acylphosphatase [Parendozoicomonas haliclonae]
MSKVCRKAIVRGKVQGVWYRASTRQRAEALEVNGWAKNCADGSVEVMMCGEESAVTRLTDWLYEGPPLAVVEAIDIEELPCAHLTGFFTQ